MKQVICDHAGVSAKWCTPRRCRHSMPHDEYIYCGEEVCGYINKTVQCVEVKDSTEVPACST